MIAEYVAMFYLTCKGYRIIAHRYKTPVGEIDILITDSGVSPVTVEELRNHGVEVIVV